MSANLDRHRPRFPVLAFLASLKAARDFGLEPSAAESIALRFDPRAGDRDELVDALTDALVARGALDVPGSA